MATPLREADIFLTRGNGLISRAIRFFTRGAGESRSEVNHVGIVVAGGQIEEAVVIEALSRVKQHSLWARYAPKTTTSVAVFRPLQLTNEQRTHVVEKATEYRDRKYGYFKVLAHMLDWALQGIYLFRRLTNDDRYPICSWLVAHSFKAVGIHFDTPPGAASPDDIWDFVNASSEFEELRPLSPLEPS